MPLEAFLNTCELIEADPKAVIDASYKRLLDELGTPDEYREREFQVTDDLVGPRFEDLSPLDLAASRDMNRDMESETPDE